MNKISQFAVFVIPGLTRNPVLFESHTELDAGSVILDLIRDRHDKQKLNTILNYDTVFKRRGSLRIEGD